MLPAHTNTKMTDFSVGTDIPTCLFRSAAGILTAPMARQIATNEGNRISHYALFDGLWGQAEQLANDGQAFVDAISPFCDTQSEIGQRVTALHISVWRPKVAELGGSSSSVSITLLRDELGQRTLEFARAVRPNQQQARTALLQGGNINPRALADDNAVAVFVTDDDSKPRALGEFLMSLIRADAPHRALEQSPHFVVRPAGIDLV